MKVLIPLEDKVYGDAIAEFVGSHNWPKHTSFRLLHVDNFDALCGFSGQLPCQHSHEYALERRRRIKALLLDVATQIQIALPDAHVEELTLSGYVPDAILGNAAEWSADMIVMGSHGRGAFDRLMLGSVSLAVLTHAECSVMIVRSRREQSVPHAAAEKVDVATPPVTVG